MNTYAFDIETYSNYFLVIFVNVKSTEERYRFEISPWRDDTIRLKRFLDNPITLAGFNNYHFDDLLLKALNLKTLNGEGLNFGLYNLAQDIIKDKLSYQQKNAIRKTEVKYKTIDLKLVAGIDTSLKRVGINLKWHKIQDLPIHHAAEITEHQVTTIVQYCLNDVMITARMHHNLIGRIEMRQELSELYKQDLTSASDSMIANIILESAYLKKSGIFQQELKKLGTPRRKIKVSDCISSKISFKTIELKKLLSDLNMMELEPNSAGRFRLKYRVLFRGNEFSFGVGGIHTKDAPGIFESDENNILRLADVTSFYPYIALNDLICPEHLDSRIFFDIFGNIVQTRFSAKESGFISQAEGLKITVNSTIGKMENEHSWLYDPIAFLSVTISGQLYILMLVEMLEEAGLNVISSNTDGLVVYISRDREKDYYSVCKEWERITEFILEYGTFQRYFRSDVNRYLAIGDNGKITSKGIFNIDGEPGKEEEVNLTRGYKSPIIPKALRAYFLDGTPVKEFLSESDDIYDFLIGYRLGKDKTTGNLFQSHLRRNGTTEQLQKTNRYYSALDGGELYKKSKGGQIEIGVCVDSPVCILNDVPNKPFESFGVNMQWYEKKIMEIINKVDPPVSQLKLF